MKKKSNNNKSRKNCKLNFYRVYINLHFHQIDHNNEKQHGHSKNISKT